MTVSYCVRNSADKEYDTSSLRSEAATVVVPMKAAQQFAALSITDQQFIDASEIYLLDDDGRVPRKTELKIT